MSPDAIAASGHELSLLRDQLVGHGYRIFDLLGFEVSEPDAWAASAPETGVFDYIAAHPGNGDDVAIITSVLTRSFEAERLDLSAHGMPELLGRVETVASQTALITEPIETDNVTDQLETTFIAGPSSPQGTIWPGGAAGVGRFMLAWKGDDHGLLFDHSDGSVIEVDGRLIPSTRTAWPMCWTSDTKWRSNSIFRRDRNQKSPDHRRTSPSRFPNHGTLSDSQERQTRGPVDLRWQDPSGRRRDIFPRADDHLGGSFPNRMAPRGSRKFGHDNGDDARDFR